MGGAGGKVGGKREAEGRVGGCRLEALWWWWWCVGKWMGGCKVSYKQEGGQEKASLG